MSRPRYQEIGAVDIPVVDLPGGAAVRVVAGRLGDARGPITDIYAEPEFLDVRLPAGVSFEHPVPPGDSCMAYVFEGSASFGVGCDLGHRGDLGGRPAQAPMLVVFGDGDTVCVQTYDDGVRFLLVSAEPLNEPVARYGPFVMNTPEEIGTALADLRADEFIWRDDPDWARAHRAW